MSGRLDGKVALVTGGGTGIGRAITEAYAHAGARVVVSGRRREPLEAVVAALGKDVARAVPADVTIAGDRAHLLASVREAFGGLDILVNNAGAVSGVVPVADLTDDEWERMLQVNVSSAVYLTRDALPMLRERKGNVVNISTGASLKPVPRFAAYGASKVALNYVSQVLALELAPDVRVNVICPGGVDTPIFGTFVAEESIPDVHRGFADSTPLGRIGAPEDIARAALFLASDDASFVTGVILVVDGGLNLG